MLSPEAILLSLSKNKTGRIAATRSVSDLYRSIIVAARMIRPGINAWSRPNDRAGADAAFHKTTAVPVAATDERDAFDAARILNGSPERTGVG